MTSSSYPIRSARPAGRRWSTLLAFEGIPSRQNVDHLLIQVEDLVVQRTEDRKAFRAIIECVQNLERHAVPDLPARFTLSGRIVKGEPRFCIRSLNPIREEDITDVVDWIAQYDELQCMVLDAMEEGMLDWRQLYRNWLERGDRTPRGGAGLGWVSMARMALNPPHVRVVDAGGRPNLFFSVEVACGS